MPSFTINVPTSDLPDVVAAFSETYVETLPDGTENPLTKTQHAKNEIRNDFKRKVQRYRRSQQVEPTDPDIEVT